MDPGSAPLGGPIDASTAPPRQRWRLVLSRAADAPQIAGRELADALERAIEGTGLPLHRQIGRARGRVALAAPLPLGMAADAELADIVLTEMLPALRVREALTGSLPPGWSLGDLYDVWLGAPALAGIVRGAIYRIVVEGSAAPHALAAGVAALLEATRLPRTRMKGGAQVAYDLRPLLVAITIVTPGPPAVLRVQTRIHPELGTGRPEEVIAALADRLGSALAPASMVRERIVLAEEPA